MKRFLVTLVLALSVAGMALPQTVGVGVGPTFGESISAVEKLYRSSLLRYSFNDPSNLGKASGGGNDLTESTPVASGGALSYAMKQLEASTQAGWILDNASLSLGTNIDFGFCAWVRPLQTQAAHGEYIVAKTQVEYYLLDNTSDKWQFGVTDAVSGSSTAISTLGATVNRADFVCGWYTSSDGFANISVNDETPVKDLSGPITTPVDGTQSFAIGARNSVGGDGLVEGVIGPVYFYKGAVPPHTSLWNGGTGYSCATTPAALKTNGVSCWEMDENGGPYVDAWGTNDLTARNTPTQGPGFVPRSDSGTALYLDSLSLTADATTAQIAAYTTGNPRTYTFWALKTGEPWGEFVEIHAGGYVSLRITGGGGASRYIINAWDNTNTLTCQAIAAADELNQWVHYTVRLTATECSISIDAGRLSATDALYPRAGAPANPADDFAMGSGWTPATPAVIDNFAVWGENLSAAKEDELYEAGAGTFFAAVFDTIFHGPRLAWSQKPTLTRRF
jgi:hypothetical protein